MVQATRSLQGTRPGDRSSPQVALCPGSRHTHLPGNLTGRFLHWRYKANIRQGPGAALGSHLESTPEPGKSLSWPQPWKTGSNHSHDSVRPQPSPFPQRVNGSPRRPGHQLLLQGEGGPGAGVSPGSHH